MPWEPASSSSAGRTNVTIRRGRRGLPACTAPAFDVQGSSRSIDAEVRRRLRAGEPLYHIDAERIHALRPDVLIAQAHCEVCAATPGNVVQVGAVAAERIVPLHAGSLAGIFADVLRVAAALDRPAAGETLVAEMQQRVECVRRSVAGRPRPTIVAIEWTDPIFTMGNWGPELIDMAGGKPLLSAAERILAGGRLERYSSRRPRRAVDRPLRIRSRSNPGGAAHSRIAPRLAGTASDRSRAASYFADGNLYFNRSGTTIADTVEILADMLHGSHATRHRLSRAWTSLCGDGLATSRGCRTGGPSRAGDHLSNATFLAVRFSMGLPTVTSTALSLPTASA